MSQGQCLVDWTVAGSGGGEQLLAADLLVFIRMLFFLMADFGCATKKIGGVQLLLWGLHTEK
jgi:hypothetical protein